MRAILVVVVVASIVAGGVYARPGAGCGSVVSDPNGLADATFVALDSKEAGAFLPNPRWTNSKGTFENEGTGGVLWSRMRCRNFVLRSDYRLLTAGEGGIKLRGGAQCEVQLTSAPGGSGGIRPFVVAEKASEADRTAATPVKRADRAVGQWNQILVYLHCDRISVTINGTKVVDGFRLYGTSRDGLIGFVSRGAAMQVRNSRVYPIYSSGGNCGCRRRLIGYR